MNITFYQEKSESPLYLGLWFCVMNHIEHTRAVDPLHHIRKFSSILDIFHFEKSLRIT